MTGVCVGKGVSVGATVGGALVAVGNTSIVGGALLGVGKAMVGVGTYGVGVGICVAVGKTGVEVGGVVGMAKVGQGVDVGRGVSLILMILACALSSSALAICALTYTAKPMSTKNRPHAAAKPAMLRIAKPNKQKL